MTADLTVSMDRDGIVVEIERTHQGYRNPKGTIIIPAHRKLMGATLSPDEARAKASELNDAADAFEARAYQFPSRIVGSPR